MRFQTATPYPLMPSDLTQVFIVSRKSEGAIDRRLQQRQGGRSARARTSSSRYAKGDRIELARFDGYWGGRTPWDKVTMRLLPQNAPRVAALLVRRRAGDRGRAERRPRAPEAGQAHHDLRAPSSTGTSTCTSTATATSSPFVTDKDGKPLERNPLKDPRVRHALSKAIDRNAIVARVMEGEAVPAGQLIPEFLFGATKNLKVEKFDPDGAKKLLAEAG